MLIDQMSSCDFSSSPLTTNIIFLNSRVSSLWGSFFPPQLSKSQKNWTCSITITGCAWHSAPSDHTAFSVTTERVQGPLINMLWTPPPVSKLLHLVGINYISKFAFYVISLLLNIGFTHKLHSFHIYWICEAGWVMQGPSIVCFQGTQSQIQETCHKDANIYWYSLTYLNSILTNQRQRKLKAKWMVYTRVNRSSKGQVIAVSWIDQGRLYGGGTKP